MNELDLLQDEEQSLHAALKAVRAKRESALEAQAEQAALEAQLRHEAHMKRVAELAPVRVFGVTYESLRKASKATSVRFVPVHTDVCKLLRAALPASSDEQFVELCTALVSKLMGYGASLEAAEAIDTLRVSKDASRYFDPALRNEVTVVTCDGRLASTEHEKFSDMLTAYALSWGSATQYEDSENE